MSTTPHSDVSGHGHVDFRAVQASEEFREVRRTHRSFVFPMAVVFLVWYFIFVLLAAFAPEFMAIRVWGNITLGIVLGLLQFVSTFVITGAYVAYTNRRLDPKSTAIREELEAIEPELAATDPHQVEVPAADKDAAHGATGSTGSTGATDHGDDHNEGGAR